jgi:hypothetical protein
MFQLDSNIPFKQKTISDYMAEDEDRKLKKMQVDATIEDAKARRLSDYMKMNQPDFKVVGNQVVSIDPATGEIVPAYTAPPKGSYVDPDTGQIIEEPKALPVGALKLQDEAVDAYGAARSVEGEAGRLLGQLTKGELDVGPVRNLQSIIRNKTGFSDTVSRNYADLDTSLEKIRNDSLRLNKGVQTEGDAERAMNEVIKNRNDPKLLKESMEKLVRVNQRGALLQKNRVKSVRDNYKAGPYDFGEIDGAMPSAPSGGGWKIEAVE